MEPYYIHLNKKLDKLQKIGQQPEPKQPNTEHPKETGHHFYPRVENLTNISFTKGNSAKETKINNLNHISPPLQPHNSHTYSTGIQQMRCTAPDDGLIQSETCRASNGK